jgi:hypothetical protein
MPSQLSIESPNFEKIASEAGQFTADAIGLVWGALNATRTEARRDFRRSSDIIQPKMLSLSPSASVDNLDLAGCSVVHFTGGTQNVTGFRAPETGTTRVLILANTGGGTITVKHDATSESANRIVTKSGADVTLTLMVLIYLNSRWREVAQ